MAKLTFKSLKIIWHMGFQKAGNTGFQSILRRNDEHTCGVVSDENFIALEPYDHIVRILENSLDIVGRKMRNNRGAFT